MSQFSSFAGDDLDINLNEEDLTTFGAEMTHINSEEFTKYFNVNIGNSLEEQMLISEMGNIKNEEHSEQPLTLPLDLGHMSRIPNIVPVNTPYDFEVTVPADSNNVFSQGKLFIKMNSKMIINVSYRPQRREEQLYVRAMIIFSNPAEMHLPVKRCANHRNAIMANINDGDQMHKQRIEANILKINDPKAAYFGEESGTTFSQRLSIVVPLESNEFDESGKIKQVIGLEFGCQNSCSSGINRRPTSIVFTLESNQYELLGKAVIEFKVCSCPKRDADRERNEPKRKHDSNEPFPRGKRPKYTKPQPNIKPEPESESDSNENTNANNAQMATTFSVSKVQLSIPTEMVPELLKYAFNMVAGKMAEDSKRPTNYEHYETILKDLKKMRKQHSNNQ